MLTEPMALRRVQSALALLLCIGCGGGEEETPVGAAPERQSSLCADLSGNEGLAWDIYNGTVVADPSLPPPFPVGGGTYSHSTLPLLGFSFPGGWAAFEDPTVGVVGVDLIRDDERAAWRYRAGTVNGFAQADSVLGGELEGLAGFVGAVVGQTNFVCTSSSTAQPALGISTEFSGAFVRMAEATALVTVSVTRVDGLPTSQVFVRSMVAPTGEFSARAYDTFLAIDWQFLAGNTSNLRDRDGDGWPDGIDTFPDDPTRN